MIPLRFRIIRPYLASFIHKRFGRPPLPEVFHWLFQPGKEKRALRYVEDRRDHGSFTEIRFYGHEQPFFYPNDASWIDFCQTADEVFNSRNWHHFISDETPVKPNDTIVDCGAAEGLFSFYVARHVKNVYAIEPIPMWHAAMDKTFQAFDNVEVKKVGVGHANAEMRMTNDEIYSRVSAKGELKIPIRTIDSMFAEDSVPVTFLKADIEGFEFPMLLGAQETIRENRPKISLTMYHGSNHFLEVQEFLLNIHNDYRFRLRGIAENGNPVLMQAY